jgi:hypothetical protein
MKKILAFILILFVSGCTVVRIDTTNIDTIVNVVLSKDNTLYNRIGNGYKYYVPRGVSYIDTDDLNDKLYSNGTYYYLYVDVISYNNEVEFEYEEKEDIYYSRKISLDDGFKNSGYLEIEKKNNLYYVKFLYNYARIEAMVDKDNINVAVLNSAYILSTIQFNSDVINLMLDEEYFTNKEEKYGVFAKSDKTVNNFELQYNND